MNFREVGRHVSASQITAFENCPRLWWLDKIAAKVPRVSSAAQDMGSEVHEVLEESHILAVRARIKSNLAKMQVTADLPEHSPRTPCTAKNMADARTGRGAGLRSPAEPWVSDYQGRGRA